MPRARVSDSESKSKRSRVLKPKAAKRSSVRRSARAKSAQAAEEMSQSLPVVEHEVPSLAHGHVVHAPGQVVLRPRERRRHQLIISIGVVIIMMVIVSVWIINLKRIISSDNLAISEARPSQTQVDFEKLKEQLNSSLTTVKEGLGTLSQTGSATHTVTPSVTPSVSPQISPQPSSTVTPSANPSTLPPTLP